MKELTFTNEIQAPKEKVWNVLWQDKTFRQWAGVIDPGTYMVGELREGSEVQFISAENGYGVTSLVEKCIPNELLVFRHQADTQGSGTQARKNEWTGGTERYELTERNGLTTLTATFDVPQDLENYFNDTYPKAIDIVKTLSEVA